MPSFGRHKRSVQAHVLLCDVTPDRAARRQRALASSAVLGKCVRSGNWRERTSVRSGETGCSGRSMNWDAGLFTAGWHLGQHGLVMEEMRREQTGQTWSELSASHWTGTWPCRSPVMCISTGVLRPYFVVRLWASFPWRDGQQETRKC